MNETTSPEQLNLGILLLRAFQWFDDELLKRIAARGWPEMTRPHSLIYAYMVTGCTRPAELARRIGVSRQAVHSTLNEMVELGLIELAPDPEDQRAKIVVLTERGSRNVADARAVLVELERELARRIGAERVAALRDALEAEWGDHSGGIDPDA